MKNLIVNKGSGILLIQTYFETPGYFGSPKLSDKAYNLVLIDVMTKEYQKEREKSVKDALEFFGQFAGLLSDLSEDDKRIFNEIILDRRMFFREREF